LIIWLSVVSVVSLTLFVIIELFSEHPVLNLRTFRNVTFSAGNVIMFFAFFNLFGSIVLLPIFLQSLMGYTATLAGFVLGPGGVASLIAMPIAGRLITRVDPRKLLGFGIIVAAYSTYLMSNFSLGADFNTVIWPRLVLGVGMGFIFIPLTTMTMSGIRKEDMANAASIYNLLRNLGGSFGVAFITTMISRRSQFHQSRLAEHLTPFDTGYRITSSQLSQALQQKGLDAVSAQQAGQAGMYGQLMKHASMLSFNDAFYLLSVLMICTLPFLVFMRRSRMEH
ncbi:MAG: MFS transporter, partial [Nitrospirota bacterium]|nr:MFS transporter [Nitrospirota bacterium]